MTTTSSSQRSFVASAEFFPPKSEEGRQQFLATAQALAPLQLDYVSITYGAGGSTQELTREYADRLQDDFAFPVMPHLTCVGHSREEIKELVAGYYQKGHRKIMALRGDKPKDAHTFPVAENGFRYGSELVAFLKQEFPDLQIGVGGYPEKHPESANIQQDIEHLAHKVSQGADFITTQLFFDNSIFYQWRQQCQDAGISAPIYPGILPVVNYQTLHRFCQFCGASIPDPLEAILAPIKDDDEAVIAAGITWAVQQIQDLLAHDTPGFHLYCLNKPHSAQQIFQQVLA